MKMTIFEGTVEEIKEILPAIANSQKLGEDSDIKVQDYQVLSKPHEIPEESK